MNIKQLNHLTADLTTRIIYGVKLGAAKARLQHKLAGRSMFVYENGKVIEVLPEDIEINEPIKSMT